MAVVIQDLVRKRWVTKRHPIQEQRAVCLRLSRLSEAMARTITHRDGHVDTTLTEFAYSGRMRISMP